MYVEWFPWGDDVCIGMHAFSLHPIFKRQLFHGVCVKNKLFNTNFLHWCSNIDEKFHGGYELMSQGYIVVAYNTEIGNGPLHTHFSCNSFSLKGGWSEISTYAQHYG